MATASPRPSPGRPARSHRLYAHVAWTTLARLPLVPAARRFSAESHLIAACRRLGADPVEVCIFPDRVHLLVRYAPARALGDLAAQLQSASEEALAEAGFAVRWSRRFAAESVSPGEVRRMRRKMVGRG